ncbi:hypothetical protein BN2475_540034 [Paraburkholderia ribeironis]|uniref:Uncharacterized protein n=1 Tax=Paraburkholderia ribeironis TaxID=1247936 RepID=A0A1N7SD82_9BURK|nr:hypothetical protein BN2475_540034 [Paraburkholderia ribeironis]
MDATQAAQYSGHHLTEWFFANKTCSGAKKAVLSF